MKLNRTNTPKVYTDLRPLSEARLARGEARESWRLWMLALSFGGIVLLSLVAAVIS